MAVRLCSSSLSGTGGGAGKYPAQMKPKTKKRGSVILPEYLKREPRNPGRVCKKKYLPKTERGLQQRGCRRKPRMRGDKQIGVSPGRKKDLLPVTCKWPYRRHFHPPRGKRRKDLAREPRK